MDKPCAGCDRTFRDEDLAPFQRDSAGGLVEACRSCIGEWVKLGVLWPSLPFWKRKEGADR